MAGHKQSVRLVQAHKNAGTELPAGSVLVVAESTAEWLFRHGIAEPDNGPATPPQPTQSTQENEQ
ncbi:MULTISPECIES: hypothetical protein [unclassified Chromobacterium]|uniref:DUF7210 family protein n=1 Tax=unclassified Chromobacterium TaxID=2641838 RepID=UPI001F35AA27|nr:MULTISPECIES: hypothetical protein [unclassified Chromobacterium]UJB30231.1 hypothetical protein HQN78_03665 [Chromobacterium sp. Beijing]